MAHGHGTGPLFLIDEDGNVVKVELQNGKYLLGVIDDRVFEELRQIREALKKPEETNPWAMDSPRP